MEAKDPCVDCPDIDVDEYGYLCDLACGKRTAWLNFKAGIKEVVDFVQTERKNRNPADWYSRWQAKLKEWGLE